MASEIAYFNGVFAPPAELSVPLLDRGFLFGDGIYEVVVTFGRVPFGLREHLDRFYTGMEFMRLNPPFATREELERVIQEGIDKVEGTELMIYFQLTRGAAIPRKHVFPQGTSPNFMMHIWPAPDTAQLLEEGIRATLEEDIRWRRCDIKTINLIPAVLATQGAAESGAVEAILHRDGLLTEGASSNVFIVADGVLRTPPLSRAILPGITRGHILRLAGELGIPVREEPIRLEELYRAQEVFMTSVNKRAAAVVRVGDHQVGAGRPGPVTRRLRDAYKEMIAKTCGL